MSQAMTIEEKVNLMFEYVRSDYLLACAVIDKNDAVRAQDFNKAMVFREKENELRKQRLLLFEKVFNSEQNPERSVATEDQSGNKS